VQNVPGHEGEAQGSNGPKRRDTRLSRREGGSCLSKRDLKGASIAGSLGNPCVKGDRLFHPKDSNHGGG